MPEAIQITRVPHNPGNVFFERGTKLKDKRFWDSDYYDSLSIPDLIENKKIIPAAPLIGLFANEGIEIVGQMYVYDAHLPVSLEIDFPEQVAMYRELNLRNNMIVFGDLASDEKMVCSPRVAGKLFREGFRFAMENGCGAALACVHPKHLNFYVNMIGFTSVGYVDNVSGLKNAPGYLLYATQNTIHKEKLRRLK